MNNKKYTQEDVDEWVFENGEKEASLLFEINLPGYRKKLDRIDRSIGKILEEIRAVFPDACFYTSGGDGFTLVLGCTHDHKSDKALHHRVAWNGIKASISGGDW